MANYYYIENDIQKGPFSFQDLKDKKIQKNTLVWCENMENWEEAKNIEEFKEILKYTPPPIPIAPKIEKPLKVEAEIIRKKEKIITPEKEILIAKETKRIFKNSFYIIISSLVFFFIMFGYNEGISNFMIKQNLQNDWQTEEEGTFRYCQTDNENN